jgi:uncharacterized protein YdhG (YjbR/CyaY superfamily)
MASIIKSKAVTEYIALQPKNVQAILKKVRTLIQRVVPQAEEGMAYGMPGYKIYGKPLVYFAGWKTHIGFYATPSGNKAFAKELSAYEGAKGSVKFSLDEPIPYTLIKKIVVYRVKENKDKFGKKKK